MFVSLVLTVAAGARNLGVEIHPPLKDDRRVVDVHRSPNTQILRALERLRGGKCSDTTDDMSRPPHNDHPSPFLLPTTEQPPRKPIKIYINCFDDTAHVVFLISRECAI